MIRIDNKGRLARVLSLGVSAIAMTALATPALAQNAQDDHGGIGEIIVTAQKREQNLQSTPVSITAVTDAALQARDAGNIAAVASLAPNLQISTGKGDGGSTNAAVFIRGVGQNDFIFPTDPGVGIYLDGVYIARSMGAMMDLSDIARIEVLRGPQGTLYGKNTIGGAINVISSRPGNDLSGMLRGTVGSRGRLDVEGRINLPLINDVLALKVAVASKNQDGYVHRPDGVDLGDTKAQVGRIALAWNPSSAVKVDLAFDGSRIRQNGAPQRLTDTFSFPGGLHDLYNALGAPYIAARDHLPAGSLFDDRWIASDRHTSYGNGPTGDRADVWGSNLTIDWAASDAISIKSITAYREMKARLNVDMDQTPFPIVHTDERQSENQFSQEFQFSGASDDKRLHWLVGAYYFQEHARDLNQTRLASGIYDALNRLPAALVPLTPTAVCPPMTPFQPCAGGAGNPLNALLDLDVRPLSTLRTKNWAVFGQGSYEIVPTFTITLGGRYSWEKKNYFLDSLYPNSGRVATAPTNDSRTWKNFTPKVGFDWQATPDVLFYGSWSKGFKSGGWNPRPLTPEEFKSFDPEKLDAFEVGLKTRFLNRRATFNVSGFFNKYKAIQLFSTGISPTGGFITTVDNAGNMDIYGFEAELAVQPVDGLQLNGSVGYLHNKYTKLAPGVGYPLTNKLPYAPDWTANLGAQYRLELGGAGALTVRGDMAYRGSTYFDPRNSPSIRQPGYTLYDARLAWTSADDKIELALFGKNLTNKKYYSAAEWVSAFGLEVRVVGRPREWGGSLTLRF